MSNSARPGKAALIRDLLIFQMKLVIDGLKDVVLVQLALLAAVFDIVFGKPGRPLVFYGVMRMGERFDLWMNLYGAAERAAHTEDGLFGASRAGSPTMLGKLEEMVRNGEEVEGGPRAGTAQL
jgi:hypothetical protein